MSYVWFVVRWTHLLAMAFFVGGQAVVAVAVVPVGRRAPDREQLRAIARRFGYASAVAVAILIATGTAMAFHAGLWGSTALHVKLVLVALIGVLLVWHVRRPGTHALEAAIFLCSLAVTWIGLYLANGYS